MIKALLKSLALVVAYVIIQAVLNGALYLIGVDYANTSTLIKIGLAEHIGWLFVIGVCIHWIINGFKKLIGKN